MPVDRSYFRKKSSGPSKPKMFLDKRFVPLAVNVAGALEVALDRASVRTGIRPAAIMAGLTVTLSLLIVRLVRRPRTAPFPQDLTRVRGWRHVTEA